MWMFAAMSVAYGAPIDADEVVRLALGRDPAVVSASADVERALGARRESNGLRLNPEAQGRWSVGGGGWEVEAFQPISLSGEGLAAARSAGASARSAELEAEFRRLVVAAEIRRLYAQSVVAGADVTRSAAAFDLAARVRDGAQARLREGGASQLDVRLATLDLARAADDLLAARREENRLRAEMAARTGLDVGAELVPDPLQVVPRATGAGERPDLIAAEERLTAARAALSRERSALVPLVGLGAFAQGSGGVTEGGPLVELEIPLWTHNPSGRADARADLLVAEADRAAIAARVDAEVAQSAAMLGVVTAVEAQLPSDVGAHTQAALEAVEAAWAEGQIGFVDLGTLRLRILDGDRAWYAARAALATIRIDAMLASADPALLGP